MGSVNQFATVCIFPKPFDKICQSKFKILPHSKWTYSRRPKFYNIAPKWWNFAKSGHTDHGAVLLLKYSIAHLHILPTKGLITDTTKIRCSMFSRLCPWLAQIHICPSVTRWLDHFQHWAFYISNNLPNGVQNLPKQVQKYFRIVIKPWKIAQDFGDFTKVVKFRQIWSHQTWAFLPLFKFQYIP